MQQVARIALLNTRDSFIGAFESHCGQVIKNLW